MPAALKVHLRCCAASCTMMAIRFIICRIDTGEHVAQDLYEAICSAADSIDVDTAMVRGVSVT